MIAAFDNSGELCIWNKRCETLTGYLAKDLLNTKKVGHVLLADKNVLKRIHDLMKQPPEFTHTFEPISIVCADGSKKSLLVTVRKRHEPILPDLPVWFVAIDDTERSILNETLEVTNDRFKMICQATNDASWDWDIQTNSFWWTSGVAGLFESPENETVNAYTWWSEQIHPADRNRVIKTLESHALNADPTWSSEYRFRRRNGSFAHVIERGICFYNEEGKATRMVAGMTDISEKVAYQKSLIAKNQQLSDYAFFNSHKVRAPLARLMSCVQLLSLEDVDKKDTQNFLANIQSSAEELDGHIRDMQNILIQERTSFPNTID